MVLTILSIYTIIPCRAQLQHVGAGLWDGGHPQQSQEVGHVRVAQVQDGAHPQDAQEVLRLQKLGDLIRFLPQILSMNILCTWP